MGKGSRQRPRVIDNDTFEKNWNSIFDRKNKTYKEVQQDITELNAEGNRDRGRNGEDINDTTSKL